MFSFLRKKTQSSAASQKLVPLGDTISNLRSEILPLQGLHCSSCAVNIDLALEELPSVKSTTNYAKSETKIEYDPSQVTLDLIHFTIRDLGYQVNPVSSS